MKVLVTGGTGYAGRFIVEDQKTVLPVAAPEEAGAGPGRQGLRGQLIG